MRPVLGDCRFSTCSHRHEPGCAVRAALAAGRIAAGRYESYVKLYDEAEAEQAALYR
jgi:ribosome biogenesis GTPase